MDGCDVEQIVACHTEPEDPSGVGAEGPLSDLQVVGVHVCLVRVRSPGPSVDLGVHRFHREVCTLDDPHLDVGAAPGPASMGELDESLQGAQRVREVRLQDDAGLQVKEFLLHQQCLEDLQREIQIPVLLHVQVHEGLG